MKLNVKDNPWKTLSSELVYESPWIGVTKNEVINPAGNPAVYSVVHFKNLAIGIVPLDNDNNTWLVGQFRYPLNEYSWEIPEGGGDPSIDPLESAGRELLEETGIKSKSWTELMRLHLSNSVSDEFGIIYIARDLSFHEAEPEESEDITVRKMPFNEAYQMVLNGEITDGMSVAAILKTKILLDQAKI